MRFFKISLITVCLTFCLILSNAVAADVVKIGIINLQQILSTSEGGKEAQQKIQARGQEMQAELQAKYAEMTEAQQRYEREAAVMSSEARSEKERELNILNFDLEKLEEKYNTEFSTYNTELVNQFKVDVISATEKIGKKEGYTLILESSSSGVVYAPSAIDITDKVLQQYNEDYAGKSNG